MQRFNIGAATSQTPARQLSGGNIQKVLLARELSSGPLMLVANSPTSGLDVGATDTVRKLLLEAAERGVGILLISEDLDEILALADRIAVLYNGRITGIVERQQADVEQLGLMMAGAEYQACEAAIAACPRDPHRRTPDRGRVAGTGGAPELEVPNGRARAAHP